MMMMMLQMAESVSESSAPPAVYADSGKPTSSYTTAALKSELPAAEDQQLGALSADMGSGDSAAVDDPFFCQVQ